MRRFDATTQAFSAGTLAGAGSFRCDSCGFAVALHELDQLPSCPHCGCDQFKRSSLFAEHAPAEPWSGKRPEHPDWLEDARAGQTTTGDYLAYRDEERIHVVPLEEGWTRIGRSLAAHVRFDDPTVSRRHALIHREDEGARVLDDRSLNGLFVNGERVEWHQLQDGDELLIGRFRVYFLSLMDAAPRPGREPAGSVLA